MAGWLYPRRSRGASETRQAASGSSSSGTQHWDAAGRRRGGLALPLPESQRGGDEAGLLCPRWSRGTTETRRAASGRSSSGTQHRDTGQRRGRPICPRRSRDATEMRRAAAGRSSIGGAGAGSGRKSGRRPPTRWEKGRGRGGGSPDELGVSTSTLVGECVEQQQARWRRAACRGEAEAHQSPPARSPGSSASSSPPPAGSLGFIHLFCTLSYTNQFSLKRSTELVKPMAIYGVLPMAT
ncbi:hypothetical protein ACQJBY_046443 [Aegilops geniculata]